MRAARGPSSSCAMAIALLAFVLILGGCSGLPELQIPKEVAVPTPVPCVSPATRPKRPALRTEAELLALDPYRRTHAAWADLKRYEAYAAELEAVVEGCSRIPAARPRL